MQTIDSNADKAEAPKITDDLLFAGNLLYESTSFGHPGGKLMENQDRERGNNFYYPPQHLMTTKNLYLFFQDYQSVIDLFIFTIRLAHGADQAVLAASKALLKVSDDDAKKKYYQDTIDNPGVAVEKLNDFASLNSKNLTVNIVDAFLWYVSATIQSSMKKRPEIVKSRETE